MPNGEIVQQTEESESHFERTRRLGERGLWMVMHPHTGEHMDVVDFDNEIALRREAGLEGFGFWSTPLPEEVER